MCVQVEKGKIFCARACVCIWRWTQFYVCMCTVHVIMDLDTG